jgi:hypothetical protein
MISKKAAAFLGTPPGEGGGGSGKGGDAEGYHPAWQGALATEGWGYGGAGSKATNPCHRRGQQPPHSAIPEGWPTTLSVFLLSD